VLVSFYYNPNDNSLRLFLETKFLSTTFRMSDAFKIFVQYLVSCMLDPNFAAEVERKQGTIDCFCNF